MIDAALFARLSAAPGKPAALGTKIYPQQAPENESPPWAMFFQVADGSEDAQAVGEAVTAFRTLQQIDIYSNSRAEALAIATAFRGALDYQNNVEWGGMTIKASRFDSQFDGNFDSGSNLYRIIQQYRITYQQ